MKPSNILLDGAGAAHVADFGLAWIVDAEASVSATGAMVGTPAYMAPEQAAGTPGEITTAADVYALGVVLYEALAGAPPFLADTPLKTLRLVTEAEPARFGSLTPDERDHFQVGSDEERRAHRDAWTQGHIYGDGTSR